MTVSPTDMDSLRCSIKIEHKYGSSILSDKNEGHVEDCKSNHKTSYRDEQRPNPQLTTLLLRRLLRLIDAQFTIQNHVEDGQIYEVSLLLDKAASSTSDFISGGNAQEEISGLDKDPSTEQLLVFGETLKGRKVTLYARSDSAFARHMTSYITAWGMDVNCVFSDGRSERSTNEEAPTPVRESWFSTPGASAMPNPEVATSISSSKSFGSDNTSHLSFIFIDDNTGVLRECMQALRAERHPQNFNACIRPSLNRSRSSPQLARVLGQSATLHATSVVVFHFTSLANYKVTKDVIQSMMPTHGSTARFPEVMIIPKPVGPRRFLTAMHTAVTRPTIDPFFFPTAISPGTPNVQSSGSSFLPPSDSRTNQTTQTGPSLNRATQSLFASLPSPSPLAIPDYNNEYFPDPAGKFGLSPSSGYLVSSPDGQPAGIFFHPRSKKKPSPQPVEQIGNCVPTQRCLLIPKPFVRSRETKLSPSLHETSNPISAATRFHSVTHSLKDIAAIPVTPTIPTSENGVSMSEPRSTPGSNEGSSLKAILKQPSQERRDSTDKNVGAGPGKKGKNTTPANQIIPPISVLIVDGHSIVNLCLMRC